ncbi:MAG: nucleotidyltransferase family protein [Thiobacillaceae bacterium]
MQGILLAAGNSRRFGANKLLHPLPDGTPLALAATRNLIAALPNTLAVVNSKDSGLVDLLEEAGLQVSICPNAGEGMGASLAWGVARTSDADGWLIALADMPFITPATIKSVAQTVSTASRIAAPVFEGQRGHPVAFGKTYGEALMQLTGDQGARDLLLRHAAQLIGVDCQDPGVLQDIDLPEQLAR